MENQEPEIEKSHEDEVPDRDPDQKMENQDPEIEKSHEDEAPDREPDQKKLKISNTDKEAAPSPASAVIGGAERKPPKIRRRKVAIVFAFCGVGYQGMQKNPGAKTIEGELEEALFHAGAVPVADRNKPRNYEWARSARTDKGVSAVGQVVSGRFYVDPRGFAERVNSHLPDQIRVFGYKRVAPSFNSKKFCDKRRYVYLIPVFALDPSSHSEAEMARSDSGYEYVNCVECSEKGYKIPLGVMGKDNSDGTKSEFRLDISSNTCCALGTDLKPEALSSSGDGSDASSLIKTEAMKEDCCESHLESPKESEFRSDISSNTCGALGSDLKSEPLSSNGDGSDSYALIKTEATQKDCLKSNLESIKESETLVKGEMNNEVRFCYGEKEKERFNRILGYYVGSHNFHNFTTRTKAADPAANRYILSFNANTVVNLGGKDFVKCEVVGQSFMLHQIRKMIGLAVAVMRNYAPESLIQTAFKKDVRINVPMAPEVGLYLDECFFTSYNKRFRGSHDEVSMEEYKEVAEEFKWKHVYSHIGSAEEKDGSVAIWLHSLNQRNYPDLRLEEHKPDQVIFYKKIGETSEKKTHEEEKKENSDNTDIGMVNNETIQESKITVEENTTVT